MTTEDRPDPPRTGTERPELDPKNLIPVPTITVDGTGRILWVNRAAEDLIGYTREVLVGGTVGEWIHGPARRRVMRDLLAWQRGAEDEISLEIPLRSAGNRRNWAGLRVRRVAFRAGRSVFVASFFDLQGVYAERERLQRQVEELEARAQEAIAAGELKSEFLRVAGEQIRTPMSGLIEMSRLILETDLGAEQRTYAEIIARSGEHLLDIVSDLLDFTRIESGALEIRNLPFDLRVTLDTALEALGGWITEEGRRFSFTVEPDIPTALEGDPGRLRQIVLSLGRSVISVSEKTPISMSVRAVDESAHSVELRVQIRTSYPPDRQADAELVRQAFSEGDATSLSRLAGRGISLRLSRQLISLMRGRIGAAVAKDGELDISFQVPFLKREEAVAPPAELVQVVDAEEDVRLEGRRVLVADPFGRYGGQFIPQLEAWGCRATRVRSGEEVISALRSAEFLQEPFDFAVLDAVLPDRSLDSVADEIRAEPGWRVRLLMTTSMGQPGDAEWATRMGMRAYLPVPIEDDDLRDSLLEILRQGNPAEPGEPPLPLITRHWIAERRLSRGDSGATSIPSAAPVPAPDEGEAASAVAPGFQDWQQRPPKKADEWETFFGDEGKAA